MKPRLTAPKEGRGIKPPEFSRRHFPQYGGVSVLSGGLLHLLAARGQAQTAPARRARACILLFQVGGPYQADAFDPKPDAPEEMRGLFRPVATLVPGLRVTDAVPRLA